MCQNKGSGDASVVLGYNDDTNFQIVNDVSKLINLKHSYEV